MSTKVAEKKSRGDSESQRKSDFGFETGGIRLHLPMKGIHPVQLAKSPNKAVAQRIRFTKSGFAASVKLFRKTFGISQESLGRITGFSTRSIAGWEAGQTFSPAGRQKLVEIERLCAALAEIMPAEAIGDWLGEPNPAFENQPPLQVIERGESDRLWRMIFQIDAGVAN